MRGDDRLHMIVGTALRVKTEPQKLVRRVHCDSGGIAETENGDAAGFHNSLRGFLE